MTNDSHNHPDYILANARTEAGDHAGAAQLMRKAADAGVPDAQYNLGVMYNEGRGVAPDPAQAAAWFIKAAEQGVLAANDNVGICYANGIGLPRDQAKAVWWFRRAAESGFAPSQFNMGVMYANGFGVVKDDDAAFKWFSLAAAHGHAPSIQAREAVAKRNVERLIQRENSMPSGGGKGCVVLIIGMAAAALMTAGAFAQGVSW